MLIITPKISNSLQLHINFSGYAQLSPKWNKSDGYLSSSRLYYITSGTGYLKTEDETITLQPGYVYLIPAKLHHAYGCTQLEKLFFQFKLTAADSLDLLSSIDKICMIPYAQADYDILFQCYNSTDIQKIMQVKMILYKTLCQILQAHEIPPIPIQAYSKLVTDAIDYIHSHPRIDLTAASLSQILFVSESKLRTLFRSETGIPLGKYIDTQTYVKARKMLSESDISICQISASLGFCDQFYFSRFFKAKSGLTPSQYRKKCTLGES